MSQITLSLAYNRWKLLPEWKWLQSIPAPPKTAYERSRLTDRQRWLLDDLGITLTTPQSRFDAARHQNPLSSQENKPPAPQKTLEPPAKAPAAANAKEEKDSPLPPPPPPRDDTPSPEQLASVIERLQRDLAAVTQERDQLRSMLDMQRQQSPLVPQPPPPPPSVQTTDKGQVADLVQSLRAKKGQLRSTPTTTVPAPAPAAKNVLSDVLETGIRGRRKAVAGDPEEEEEEDDAFVQCQVCYSAGTLQCTDCKLAVYCSPACQKIHWGASHQHTCLPVSLRVTNE